ncbi:UPF0058 family protein [Haladaptatus cibarius]|uniref:UPF0058 family protein n=1 Tax=Haladaptatus cibarius TaxID=453847 RepID=UPI00067909A4|nr:UPF0058 family protein [Haladaptatus cibarius]
MKKQELIHLHGLLAEVRNQYEIRNDGSIEIPDYEKTGVHPTSIHHSKTAHMEAVFELTDGLTDAMKDEEAELTPHVR